MISSTQTDQIQPAVKRKFQFLSFKITFSSSPPTMVSPRLLLQIPSLVIAVLGFILMFVALATPSWQVVYARELRQWVQSGLWLSCQTRPNGMYQCTYTFSKDDFDFYTSAEVVNIRTPAFYPWQRTLLHLLLAGQFCALLAFISFCISNSPQVEKIAVIAFNILIAIATLIGLGCMLAFAAFSNMVEYRFYHVSVSGIYEKHHGYSYYIAIFACILFLVALVLSVAYTFRLLSKDGYSEGSSRDRINAYRHPADDWRSSQFSSPYMSEEQFAMRALPDLPPKYMR